MHELDLILTLTGGLAAALICGYVTLRLGLSPIVGYLAAGFIVGPNTPGFVADQHLADQFAEVGVILLMFGVGLQFHIKELLAVRQVALPGALGQSLVATALGAVVGVSQGWSWPSGIVFGLAISVASTVVLLRVLADHGDLHTRAGHIAVGWLVVEDLFTVLVLVLLPVVATQRSGGVATVVLAVGLAIAKLAAMVGLTAVAGKRLIPWLLNRIAATHSRELFTLTILVLALGIAVGSAKLFGVSMALGAFLAGMVVGRSEFSLRAATEALPMRDAFAVLFFVSVGMLFNPRQLVEAPTLVAATLAVVLIGKPVAALVIIWMLNYPLRVAIAIAVALAQIGEFSFILAQTGKSLGIVGESATSALVIGAIASISLNPILYRSIDRIEAVLGRFDKPRGRSRHPGSKGPGHDDPSQDQVSERDRVIIVGHGPIGQTLARLLIENQFEPAVIEMNLETVRKLGERGITAIYGDATHRETLEHAGAQNAIALVLSSTHMERGAETIRLARELNPALRIVACASSLRELEALRAAGASIVFSGEGELALAMTEYLLRQWGASADQIDRERARIRSDVLGDLANQHLPARGAAGRAMSDNQS